MNRVGVLKKYAFLIHVFTFLRVHILVKILVHNLRHCAILTLLRHILCCMVIYGSISAALGTKKEELGKVLLQLTIVPCIVGVLKMVFIFLERSKITCTVILLFFYL